MMKDFLTLCIAVLITVFKTSQCVGIQQTDLDRIATDLKVKAKVLDNTLNGPKSHVVRITLENTGSSAFPASGWKLYFHSLFLLYPTVFPKNKTVDLDLEKVRVSMIQGDLYSMHPITGFKAIQPNEVRYYDLTVSVWSVSRTDFMPQWYVTGDDDVTLEPRIVQSTASMDLTYVEPFDDVRQWKRYNFDRYNPYTAQQRLRRIQVDDTGKIEKLVIPTPKTVNVSNASGGTVTIDNSWTIYNNSVDASSVAAYLAKTLSLTFTTSGSAAKTVILRITPTIGNVPEAYNLNIRATQNNVELEGRDASGLFYAVQSLLSITDGYNGRNIPEIGIFDEPRYPLRGMHVDVARNFHGVDDIKRIMDAMAMYKMNTIHLHLTDDEGWRLDILSIPELVRVGGQRCHDLSETRCVIPQYGSGPFKNTTHGSGFYTVMDYMDILQYAEDRNIEVVPEFDMPGHAHAAIIAMEARFKTYNNTGNEASANQYRLVDPDDDSQYLSVQQWMDNAINPCIESTYAFIGRVLDDVISLHSDIQPLKTFHFGGDEQAVGAWENSTICQAFLKDNPSYNVSKGLKKYFVERVSRITQERGVAMRGWEDGFMDKDGLPFPLADFNNSDVSANAWDNVWEWGASQRPYALANAGYKVVMSQATHLYFDHPYEPDPEERGFYWAPRFTDTYKTFTFLPDTLYDNIGVSRSGDPQTKAEICGENMEKCDVLMKPENIRGIQGHLWSESVRTSENLDYMIFPRMLALAERAWHKAEFESVNVAQRSNLIGQEWKAFANTIGHKELARLEKIGIRYRVPPPGARVVDGSIHIATTFPGLTTEISSDKGVTWFEVLPTNPRLFPESGTVHLRTRSKDNQRYSRVIELFKDEPITRSDQPTIDYIGDNVEVRVAVIDNLNKKDNYITMQLNLTNTGSDVVMAGTWAIYLYSLYGLKMEVLDCGLKTGHVNGGLYYVTPNSNTFQIRSGQTTSCTFHNLWWSVTRTDQFPNWYVSSLGMVPRVIKNTEDETLSFVGPFDTKEKWKRTNEDQYNPLTPEERYTLFDRTTGSKEHMAPMLVPTPFSVAVDNASSMEVPSGVTWRVYNSPDFTFPAKLISEKLNIPLQNTAPQRQFITFVRQQTEYNMMESYHVDIDPQTLGITITANDMAGALYGAQTVISLVHNGNNNIMNKMTIKDKPRFSYRGLMVDTARNFKPKQWMFKMLDVMSMYKMNKLHFHLTDDEGWRFEIPGIPELTEVSSKRCHSDYTDVCVIPQLGSGPNSTVPGSGFYTIQDYRDILQYAVDRNIEVIPEVDIPGHSTAAIQAMSQREATIGRQLMHGAGDVYDSLSLTDADENSDAESPQKWRLNAINPCLNSTYEFVRQLVQGVKELHAPVMPLKAFHIGGDEVPDGIWDTSVTCKEKYSNLTTQSLQRQFVRRVADIVASFGLDLAVWEDGVYADNKPNPISDYKSPNVYVYPWSNRWELGKAKRTSEFADEGYKVILPLATHLYFDMPQEPDPEERGLYWASRVTDIRKVFDFMPDDIFANADVTRMGVPVTLDQICNVTCPVVMKPENVIGMQAVMFSESMRTEEQWHHMGFPRMLAMAERAWHKASWEETTNMTLRESLRDKDFDAFLDVLGEKEMIRLENNNVSYRVPPPGARIEMNVLKVNTRFPNHQVEYSTDMGRSWKGMGAELNLPSGSYIVMLRSRSPVLNRYSRVIQLPTGVISKATRSGPLAVALIFISSIIASPLF